MATEVLSRRNGNIMGVCMLLGLFLPHISTTLLLVNPLMCVFLYLMFRKPGKSKKFILPTLLVSTCIIISVIISLGTGIHRSNKFLLTAIDILMLFILFPFAEDSKIPNRYYYFAIGFILFSQVIYLFDLRFIQNLFETLYPVSESDEGIFNYMRENISVAGIFKFRLGGLYRNPNQAARFITLITTVYLIDNKDKSIKKVLLFTSVCFLSVIMTGSRTGLVVFILLVAYFIYSTPQLSRNQKYPLLFIGVVALLPFFVIEVEDLRAFQVEQGLSNSANLKWLVFADYLSQQNSFAHLAFGYADPDTFIPTTYTLMTKFDSEYGNMIYAYGILGSLAFFYFYYVCFKQSGKFERIYFILLLWIVSSTILFSYRMSFLFLFLMSHILKEKVNA